MKFKLSDVKESVEHVFDQTIKIPEPPISWRDKIEALEESDLFNQRASCIFDMRKWQVETLGFQHIESHDMVEMIMGEKCTDVTYSTNRQEHEWAYDHHSDEILKGWGGKPAIFSCIKRIGLWHLPPFSKKKIWSVQFGKLNYLKREIPYGVVLRINECKKQKIFNAFNVIAPMEAWEQKTDIDPIVVGTIWELPPSNDDGTGKPKDVGQVAHYFIAQW